MIASENTVVLIPETGTNTRRTIRVKVTAWCLLSIALVF